MLVQVIAGGPIGWPSLIAVLILVLREVHC